MSKMITQGMIDSGCKAWSHAYAFGALEAGVEMYLKGEKTRDSLTALLARIQLEHSSYKTFRDLGLTPENALYSVPGAYGAAAAADSRPAAGDREAPSPR